MHTDISAPRSVLWRLGIGATLTNGEGSWGIWGGYYGPSYHMALVGWGASMDRMQSLPVWVSTMELRKQYQAR